ncbi:malto-oligosyltrehalose synthase [Acidicapsa ligni]|uniref:malto-oligosyltrehalose synthase n=1 Tax=Acidicapsa ligni TaxID=542300 RepID=UPI0021DF8A86|nr:malto-oligosyltrehalose synthase [Acidicapsa ligni]
MPQIPLSTYRLQLYAGFTFEDAAGVADYIEALGISHVYCSPYLQAVSGSTHGYDVVDHQRPNEELGGEEGHSLFCQRLKDLGLGQVLDIVPNHMALGEQNRYWWDVIENGPSSRYATWFDIDWHSAEVKLQNKVLIPVLDDQYGRVLSSGRIRMEYTGERFQIRYVDNLFPVAPRSLSSLLTRAAEYAHNDTLHFIAASFLALPSPDSIDRGAASARHRDKTVIYGLLKQLCEKQPEVQAAISRGVDELNHEIDALDDVLNQQSYRLAYWPTADQELGYRRFFDVNTLIGLRMEREHVFEATHCRILKWLEDGTLDGVRIDHPDGLRDPLQYFERLRKRAPDAWIIGEKILEPGEFLRESWPIQGTSGYDFMNVCNRLIVHGEGLIELTKTYSEFTNEPIDFAELSHQKKQMVEQEALGSDINRLASLFVEICENNRDRRDYTRAEIRRALREVASFFPVYRTYVVADRDRIVDEDHANIEKAIALAKDRRQDLDAGLFDFIADVLTLRVRGKVESEFLMRFQQFTSTVMAKGVEDTAFYCFNRMIGLNEVGNDPGCDGISVAEFHDYSAKMQATHPLTMTTLSTHDTKRADDVRARLATITEIPGRWRAVLNRWSRMNAQFRTANFPDRNTECFLYQTLIGAWPVTKDRLTAYMEKATREAKQQTGWTQQNKEFEEALRNFIERILESPEFIAELEAFVGRVLQAGRINSLVQTLVKFTAPGVPDTYQGSELWDLSLVDPDNRRPVDYETRRTILNDLKKGMLAEEIMREIDRGVPKMWVTHKALSLRRQHPEWFGADAGYTPLLAEGLKREHVVAYLRGSHVVTIVPRWTLKLGDSWASTTLNLPQGNWKNALTGDVIKGGRLRVQTLLQHFPVALLTRETE